MVKEKLADLEEGDISEDMLKELDSISRKTAADMGCDSNETEFAIQMAQINRGAMGQVYNYVISGLCDEHKPLFMTDEMQMKMLEVSTEILTRVVKRSHEQIRSILKKHVQ